MGARCELELEPVVDDIHGYGLLLLDGNQSKGRGKESSPGEVMLTEGLQERWTGPRRRR